MKTRTGVAAFGLGDTVSSQAGPCQGSGFFLADVVLPQDPLGALRAGKEAEAERVHSGLSWPKEAQIELGKLLRRVPVPCAWNLFVEAGDTTARWNAPRGSFSLATILAEHVCTLLRDAGGGAADADELVVTIPDHLAEYGQTALLQELRHRLPRSEIRLLWRPVAAALAWLEAVRGDLGTVDAARDWLAVVYLGADGIECTGFRLQQDSATGYVLPVRKRPAEAPGFSGADWAVDAMANRLHLGTDDPGAFWQVFTDFPEVWQALAGRPWDRPQFSKVWSKAGSWCAWEPSSELRRDLFGVPVGGGKALWEILGPSSSVVHEVQRGLGQTWGTYLRDAVSRLVRRMEGGRLRGAVVCGPLAPRDPTSWLDGFGMPASCTPQPNALWLATGQDDPVAAGGRLYGERLEQKLPTYLDTLPQLTTVVVDNYEYEDVLLVEAQTCKGGEPYNHSVDGKFQLQKDCDWVEFYLKPEGQASSSRQDGRRKRAPYRKGKMRFPAAPDQDTVIDLMVVMRPASGLAQVELVPRQKDFLRGRQVFFDYSHMEDVDALPPLKRGWPEVVKMEVTDDPAVLTQQGDIQRFLDAAVTDPNYVKILENAKRAWSTPKTMQRDGASVRLMKIDQDGRAGSPEGQAVVAKLQDKLEEDFSQSQLAQYRDKIITMGTWLWGGTPSVISKSLENYFGKHFTQWDAQWNYFAEAASRCFSENRQYKILFCSIYDRIIKSTSILQFPINAARSIYRVLNYRENSQEALTQEQADFFLEQALKKIDSEIRSTNLKRAFSQGVLLFLALLRYRKINKKFMSPDEPRYAGVFDHLKNSLGLAEERAREQPGRAADRIAYWLREIMQYVHFEGTPGIIQALMEQAEDEEDARGTSAGERT